MAISLPFTELLSCDHAVDEGQHASPGKQRHESMGGIAALLLDEIEKNSNASEEIVDRSILIRRTSRIFGTMSQKARGNSLYNHNHTCDGTM